MFLQQPNLMYYLNNIYFIVNDDFAFDYSPILCYNK
jgi:hypothetical protein